MSSASFGGKSKAQSGQDGFLRVRKGALEKLMTEVMQLKEFLPKVLNRDTMETLQNARAAHTMKNHLTKEQEQLRQELLHLQSRLDVALTECQREREEKLLLREQLWQSAAELQLQADFCSGLGCAAGGLLWSCSSQEETVTRWLADGRKLQTFLVIASQTLESFVRSLGEEVKGQTEDQHSEEHQFVLSLAGTITNIAAVTSGRDFLCSSAQVLLDTLMALLDLMKPGVFPRLRVLMLMALYNVSISVRGLRYISENPRLLPVIWTLLEDGDWEVCVHALRLLQSVLMEEEVLLLLGSSLIHPDLQARVGRLTCSTQPRLRQTAQQTLEDLRALQQAHGRQQSV